MIVTSPDVGSQADESFRLTVRSQPGQLSSFLFNFPSPRTPSSKLATSDTSERRFAGHPPPRSLPTLHASRARHDSESHLSFLRMLLSWCMQTSVYANPTLSLMARLSAVAYERTETCRSTSIIPQKRRLVPATASDAPPHIYVDLFLSTATKTQQRHDLSCDDRAHCSSIDRQFSRAESSTTALSYSYDHLKTRRTDNA